MVTANEIPRLSPDAEQLLQTLAEMQTPGGHQGPYQINKELLEKLGFAYETTLEEAVQSLNSHAHDYPGFWQGQPPIMYVEDDVSPKMLVVGPYIKKSWAAYQSPR